LLEILVALLLTATLISPLIRLPTALYKSLKISQQKSEFFFEKTIFLNDLMVHLEQKKTIQNGEEITLAPHRNCNRKAIITYSFDPQENFCTLNIKLTLQKKGLEPKIYFAKLIIKPK